MQRFGDLAKTAHSRLTEAADEMISGTGEMAVWRHQDFSSLSGGASAASGIDPEGTDFETTDFVIEVLRDPDEDETVFYAQIVPSIGDLIITLRGHHNSIASARNAPASGFYRVEGTQDRRDGHGELVQCRIRTVLDQSRDYQK